MTAPDIFHVEDDADFSFIMAQALMEVNRYLQVTTVNNGKEAMVYLDKLASCNRRPGIILLDYNLPGISGLDLLVKIKEIGFLASVPVIILSTSGNPVDEQIALRLGAASFQTKPMGYRALVDKLKIICDAWYNHDN